MPRAPRPRGAPGSLTQAANVKVRSRSAAFRPACDLMGSRPSQIGPEGISSGSGVLSRARQRHVTFISPTSDSEHVLSRPTSHVRETGRRRHGSAVVATGVGSRLRCVTRDLGLGIVQVALAGRLDIATARRADRAVRAAQAGALLVVLDLRRLQLVGCTAARVALTADARARRGGGRLVVLASGAPAPRLFALARLDRRLEIVDRFPGARYEGDPL